MENHEERKAINSLIFELEKFLDQKSKSRDDVRKGGPVHSAVVAVESSRKSGRLPISEPRISWFKLTVAREREPDEKKWNRQATKHARTRLESLKKISG